MCGYNGRRGVIGVVTQPDCAFMPQADSPMAGKKVKKQLTCSQKVIIFEKT
jgi:hypothetical protein